MVRFCICFLFFVSLFIICSSPVFANTCFDLPATVAPVSENDYDGDSINNDLDNCLFIPNQNQKDANYDSVGDNCDYDQDGIPDHCDNCQSTANSDQKDGNNDGQGDACTYDSLPEKQPNNVPTETKAPEQALEISQKQEAAQDTEYPTNPKHDNIISKLIKNKDISGKELALNSVNKEEPATTKEQAPSPLENISLKKAAVVNDFSEFSDDLVLDDNFEL